MDELEKNIDSIIDDLCPDYRDKSSMINTPTRAAKAIRFLTQGYMEDPYKIVKSALFDSDFDDIVLVKDIDFCSLCEHHMLPFFGKAHIAYVPNGKIIGLSKIARIANILERKFQTQENLTAEIADVIKETSNCQGVIVKIEASHMCMMIRGVEKQQTKTITQFMSGKFKNDQNLQNRFYNLLK